MRFFSKLFKISVKQPEGTVSVLLDQSAGSDREIAAEDLAGYDEVFVQSALINVASNDSESDILKVLCGESLAEIWWRNGIFDADKLVSLTRESRYAFDSEYSVSKSLAPDGPKTNK